MTIGKLLKVCYIWVVKSLSIMIDKTQQITAFLKKHYSPGTIEDDGLQETSRGLLSILFDVFPMDCIDTDDLYNILTALGYEPQKVKKDELYWCLKENV